MRSRVVSDREQAVGEPSFLSGLWHSCGRLLHRFVPHFRVVSHGVLYRSGQPRGLGLRWVKLRGIRTLVNLRSPESSGTAEEQAFADRHGLLFHNIHVGIKRNRIAASVEEFMQIIGDPANYPVLVHCSRGKERSGVMSAIYRIEQERWSNERALEEMYRLGVSPGSIPVAEDFVRTYRRGESAVDVYADGPDAPAAVNWQE